jgi:hypothetical protein
LKVDVNKIVVNGIEVEEFPKGIEPKELERIVIKAEEKAYWNAREYWNPMKSVFENERGERLLKTSASGRLKFGLFKIFSYRVELDLINGGGKIRIRRERPNLWSAFKAILASAGLGAATFYLLRLASSVQEARLAGGLAGLLLSVLGFTIFVSVESLVEWLRREF